MKILLSIVTIFVFFTASNAQSNAQSKAISKDEYEKVFQFAVSETNSDYPVILKVFTNNIENGKAVFTETEIVENESQGYSRKKVTILEDGKETSKYQVNVGFGNVFCSDDGIKWQPSEYECRGRMTISTLEEAESTEYSVSTKSVKGKRVKIYREYSVYAPFEEGQKKNFNEKISTIDSRGFFITVEDTEGTLDPKTITLTRKQSWTTKAKIKPVVAPVK